MIYAYDDGNEINDEDLALGEEDESNEFYDERWDL